MEQDGTGWIDLAPSFWQHGILASRQSAARVSDSCIFLSRCSGNIPISPWRIPPCVCGLRTPEWASEGVGLLSTTSRLRLSVVYRRGGSTSSAQINPFPSYNSLSRRSPEPVFFFSPFCRLCSVFPRPRPPFPGTNTPSCEYMIVCGGRTKHFRWMFYWPLSTCLPPPMSASLLSYSFF